MKAKSKRIDDVAKGHGANDATIETTQGINTRGVVASDAEVAEVRRQQDRDLDWFNKRFATP